MLNSIIELLKYSKSKDENVLIAKGKYKLKRKWLLRKQ